MSSGQKFKRNKTNEGIIGNFSNPTASSPKPKKVKTKKLQPFKEGFIDISEYRLVKRAALHDEIKRTDIFVRTSSPFQALVKRAESLLDNGDKICIFGMGKTLVKAIDLARVLKDIYGSENLQISPKTGTVC